MLSATYSSFGDPASVLKAQDRPLPEPAPGQIRLKTLLSAIHNHDLLTVSGQYGYKPDLPAVGGSEAVGTVDALGEGVTGIAVGQRVAAGGLHGAWAEYVLADPKAVVPLPEAISNEDAAQLIGMPLSALFLLDFVGAKPGDWIVQNAATGAVAKVLAMIAKHRGIQVVNLVRRASAVQELSGLGIGNAVSTADEGWREQVAKIVGDAPISVAIDGVGGEEAGALMSLLAEDGQLISFGLMSGKPLQLAASDLIFKQALVKGFWLSKLMQTTPREKTNGMIGELVELVAKGIVTLQVGGTFELADVDKAVTAAAQSGRAGKILIRA
ncbi:zinc-binding dehydrogenase [Rhizobium halophytocola]|uniref:enoyl-[acyl-carrier-protein] reductase n=1 Tax=Rhizobium halophytocola TaxID=735519 RepID=A0ABS4E5U4_9HYPH|nr:zinc-binding dehydrogenase [Rhizobium halophytocola]MBP1853325.1 NADPH:quinone reductase-like Zn-dependent oxidoreductase [Rhizobium halophytocola]